MTGSELLGEVRRFHPHAMGALLVPWAGLWDRANRRRYDLAIVGEGSVAIQILHELLAAGTNRAKSG